MKKFNTLIVALFIFSISSKAEQTVGTFENAYFGKNFTIEASQKNNELETVYIEVEAKSSKSAFLSVDGNKLESFKTSLELVRDKYLSWVKIAKENNNELLCATASPYNKFSVNTFINLGYEIKKDKLKYGGLRRYVLVKNLYVNNK